MADLVVRYDQIPRFARAMKLAASETLVRETGRALNLIGKSDIQKMKSEQLTGGRLNVRFKGLLNAFKFKATESAGASSISQLDLDEYTGVKMFRIFQTGGEISPRRARTLTVLAPGARTAGGKRKYSMKELRDMIRSGAAEIIPTRNGPVVATPEFKTTKKGKLRRQSRITVLAYLRPRVGEQKRIDFFGNFEANAAEHERILGEAGDRAIGKMIDGEEGGE